MRYIFDNDLHIHSKISLCCGDDGQTSDRILQYAKENNLKTICLTNHFWDEKVEGASDWYALQDFEHINKANPLPQSENVRFLFGCETELNNKLTLGISAERLKNFDFIVIPATHFHMVGYTLTDEESSSATNKAKAWVKRVSHILDMDLPFRKVGLAHLTCHLMGETREEYLDVIEKIPVEEMTKIFDRASALGAGIELNGKDMGFSDDEANTVLLPYRIAKECGCKFYCGSDAHSTGELDKAKSVFERAIDFLGLEENDKFIL